MNLNRGQVWCSVCALCAVSGFGQALSPAAVVKLEAGNGVDHRSVTAQHRIFHYIPPGAAPAAP